MPEAVLARGYRISLLDWSLNGGRHATICFDLRPVDGEADYVAVRAASTGSLEFGASDSLLRVVRDLLTQHLDAKAVEEKGVP